MFSETMIDGQRLQEICDGNQWFPIEVVLGAKPRVRWLKAKCIELREPLFYQTISRLRAAGGGCDECVLGLDSVRKVAATHAGAVPSGFIFHISRCGSTLLSNAMGAFDGVTVISEAATINAVLAPYNDAIWPLPWDQWQQLRLALLRDLITIYSWRLVPRRPKIVVKFSSWNTLQWRVIREAWPDVPSILVTREPDAVVRSLAAEPPRWRVYKDHALAAHEIFGWRDINLTTMADEEFFARVIATLYKAGRQLLDSGCVAIDYAEMDADSFASAAQHFGLREDRSSKSKLEEVLATYSKDPQRMSKPRANIPSAADVISDVVNQIARRDYDKVLRGPFLCRRCMDKR